MVHAPAPGAVHHPEETTEIKPFPLLKQAARLALPLVAGAMLAGAAVAKDIKIAHICQGPALLSTPGATVIVHFRSRWARVKG